MAVTVTATQGNSTANGIALRVMVLTQAAATQNGATATANAAVSASITTTVTGSRVYGAAIRGINSSLTPAAATTQIDDLADATNNERFGTFKATSLTGTPGATTLGEGAGTSDNGVAMYEVLTAGTLTEDASGPAAVSDLTHTTVTTASFTPPAGSLLVALISSDGGAAQTTMAVTDTGGGYTWVAKAQANTAGSDYAGVFIAQVPAGGVSAPALPLQAPAPKPAPLPPPPGQVVSAPVAYRPVVTLSGSGTLTAGPGVGGLPLITTAVIQPPQPARPLPGRLIGLTVAAFTAAATLSGSGTLTALPGVGGQPQVITPLVQPPQPPQPPPGQITGAAPAVTFTVGATLSGTGTLTASYITAGAPPYVVTAVIQPPRPAQPPPGQVITGPPVFTGAAILSGSGTLAAAFTLAGTAPFVIAPVVQPAPPALPPPGRLLTAPSSVLLASAALSGSGTLAAAPFFSAAAALSGSGTLSAAYTTAGTAPYVIVAVIQAPQPAQPPAGRLLGVPPPPPPPVLQSATIAATVTEGTTVAVTVADAATTTATVSEQARITASVT